MDKKDAKWHETSAQTRLESARSVSDYRSVLDDCKQGLDLCDHKTAECAICANLYLICSQAYMGLDEGIGATYDFAKQSCDRAEGLGRKDAIFYRVRAQVYLGLFKGEVRCWKEAIDDCDSGLNLCGHSTAKCSVCAELYNLRAQALLYLGDFYKKQEALEVCREGLKLDDDNAGLYATCAQVYIKFKNYDSALTEINDAIKLTRDENAKFYWIRMTIYRSQGELEKARIDCERAMKLHKKRGYMLLAQNLKYRCENEIN